MVDRIHVPNAVRPKDEHELLNLFLSSNPEERKALLDSTAGASERFGRSQRTLQLWIEHGYVLAIRIGRNYQIYLPDVEQYLHSCNHSCPKQNF
jgi:excisionase family DNA binding protein